MDKERVKRGPGQPKKSPRCKYSVDIDRLVLQQAKDNHPNLHQKLVQYIHDLSESPLILLLYPFVIFG